MFPDTSKYENIEITYITGWHKDGTGDDQKYFPGGGFVIGWSKKGFGFGELTFKQVIDETGQVGWECHSECMSREFIQSVLDKFGKEIKIVD